MNLGIGRVMDKDMDFLHKNFAWELIKLQGFIFVPAVHWTLGGFREEILNAHCT